VSQIGTALICGACAFVATLALARIHPSGDAGLYVAKDAETPIMEHSPVPPEVRAILVAKCANCHSTRTRSPFYGHFAPVLWLIERDIIEARKAMNLSQWNDYSQDQQLTFETKISQQTRSHEMPPVQYRMIHWKARIADGDLEKFGKWARDQQATQTGEAPVGQGDPARGKALFERCCTGCHALTQNREGPQLHGVYGRTSGTVAGFAYSAALTKAQIVWDEKSLDKWLTDPDAFIPGNTMDFLVSKPQERQDLISYLKRRSGK
jgi:cytochrome c